MNNPTRISLLIGAGLLLGACSPLWEPTAQVTKEKDRTMVSSTAGLSHVIIYNQKNTEYTCTQPTPDVAFNQAEAADVAVSLVSIGGSSDSVDESESAEETELAGRTPAVLMTRELFYRLCEFSKNQNLSKDEAKELYGKTLTAVTDVWKVEAGQTTVTVGDTVSSTNTATISNAATQQTSATATSSSTTSDSVTDTITQGTSQ